MLRFILWALLFYGIYRLIWPSQRTVSSAGRGQSAAGHNANPGANGTTSRNANGATDTNARASTNAGYGPGSNPSQPYTRAAEREGEYIEYEEVR